MSENIGLGVQRQANLAEVERAIEMRARARLLEDEADQLKRESNLVLTQELLNIDGCRYQLTGVGEAVLVTKTSPAFSQKRLREYLVSRYSAEVAEEVFNLCTTITPIQYVQFTPRSPMVGGERR